MDIQTEKGSSQNRASQSMQLQTKKIQWIPGTPVGISVYQVESLSTQYQENLLEIIMCMEGSVTLSFGYDEFRLHAGEFISMDQDAYYLVDGTGCTCVSFFFRLEPYKERGIVSRSGMFACGSFRTIGNPGGTEVNYYKPEYLELQSLLLGLLDFLGEKERGAAGFQNQLNRAADRIMRWMVDYFDILYYYVSKGQLSDSYIECYRRLADYTWEHRFETLTLKDLSSEFHLTESYLSEFFRKSNLSFKSKIAYDRANASEGLLLLTGKSIADIASLCGFSDVKSYYKAFRRWYCCTPGEFRKMFKCGVQDKLEYLEIPEVKKQLMEIAIENHRARLLAKGQAL